MTISRFKHLYATEARADDVLWPDLFREFSKKQPFLGANHPGWSPAKFDPPERALANVKAITALVLDYDNKTPNGDRVDSPITVADATEMFGDYFGHIHTTRHHTKEWPRFRVVLPFTRELERLAYTALWQAAARRWPGLDPQPKDPSRFWYTPGVADHEGACFEELTLTGAWFDPDQFTIETPPSPAPVAGETDAQKETRARAYIEKMPPAISGAGGHQALWAVARKLVCDFGLDEQSAFRIIMSEYNPRCSPLWSEKDVRHKVSDAANKARVKNPISDRPLDPPRHAQIIPIHQNVEVVRADEWRKYLKHKPNGELLKTVGNATLIVKNADGFKGCLKYNEMAGNMFWQEEPDYSVGIDPPRAGESLSDHHVPYIQHVLLTLFNLEAGKDVVWSAMEAVAHENAFHPVQDYLNSLTWDGKPRVEKWLSTYMGAVDNIYNNSVGKWWLISAVARALSPGCQADHVLVLEGKQGKGKSQAIKALGSTPWVLESLPSLQDSNKVIEAIGGKWIVEIAELDALKGASMTRVKEFVTQQVDKYRPPYARATVERPRSCAFVGTTNEHAYLTDPTGARRFWPVDLTGRIFKKRITEDRDQLWAEAKAMYENGEQWYPTEDMIDLISEEQADRFAEDDWTPVIRRWIEARGLAETGFTSEEILREALNMEMRMWDRSAQTRVGGILTKLGYTRKRARVDGERSYRYVQSR